MISDLNELRLAILEIYSQLGELRGERCSANQEKELKALISRELLLAEQLIFLLFELEMRT